MASPSPERTHEAPFRPRARVLQLLGDELIGSPRLAVFELVKNAYDADANAVVVRIDLSSGAEPTISVTDDGDGMSLELIRSVWLVPGDDHRRRQREEGRRSPKHHRLPLGEKGLGRFAVHKLGNRIEVTTRAAGSHECVVEIDWNELIEKPFLDEAPVTVRERPAKLFVGGRTGTRIRIRELRGPEWKRGEVRRLANQITSICSPFEEPGGFRATLEVPGNEAWIGDLPDFEEILARANWECSFRLDDKGGFDFDYEFRKVPGLDLDGRTVTKRGDRLKLPPAKRGGRASDNVVANADTTRGIGPVSGRFHIFDRDREVLRRLGDSRLMTRYHLDCRRALASFPHRSRLRALPSAGVTPRLRYYGPIRHPAGPACPSRGPGCRVPGTGRASRVAAPSIFHACRRHYPGGNRPVRLSLSSRPAVGLPLITGG